MQSFSAHNLLLNTKKTNVINFRTVQNNNDTLPNLIIGENLIEHTDKT